MSRNATGPTLSALVVVHNEEKQLNKCLECLEFADELVVVLDRCTDRSADAARLFTNKIIEGDWPIEGDRRNIGIDACAGDWIIEVDADERLPQDMAGEIRLRISTASPGYFLIPFDNYIGDRLVRHGWGASWGVSAAPRLFSRGAKRWGPQRIHPSLDLTNYCGTLNTRMIHYVDRDISDMLSRLDRYTTERAHDLRASGNIGSLVGNLRRLISRFCKCFFGRKGYREGGYGVLISLCAGLYPLLSYLKARYDIK